jgi:hypothetical protein
MSTVLEYSGRAEKTVNRLYIYIYIYMKEHHFMFRVQTLNFKQNMSLSISLRLHIAQSLTLISCKSSPSSLTLSVYLFVKKILQTNFYYEKLCLFRQPSPFYFIFIYLFIYFYFILSCFYSKKLNFFSHVDKQLFSFLT